MFCNLLRTWNKTTNGAWTCGGDFYNKSLEEIQESNRKGFEAREKLKRKGIGGDK